MSCENNIQWALEEVTDNRSANFATIPLSDEDFRLIGLLAKLKSLQENPQIDNIEIVVDNNLDIELV